jgi:dienelactone hydrolase
MSTTSVRKKSGFTPSREDLPIYYDLYTPSSSPGSVLPVVLFVHGFKGFKDWGAFPDACEELARAGFAVLAMNLSRNGVGEGMMDFDQPDLFARETLTGDLEDIGVLIEAIKAKEIDSEKFTLDTDRIGIIGHSRGGHTAVAAAAEYSEIHCLITWSAVADYNARWSDDMIKDWKEKGFTEILNSRTGQTMRIDKVVYDDAIENADRVIALNRISELHIPSLFIAAKDDESVPGSESEKLYRKSPASDKEIRFIPDTGHTFGVSHPFEEEDFPEPFSEVLDHTEGWLLEYLK